jgi:hypothetical protein
VAIASLASLLIKDDLDVLTSCRGIQSKCWVYTNTLGIHGADIREHSLEKVVQHQQKKDPGAK